MLGLETQCCYSEAQEMEGNTWRAGPGLEGLPQTTEESHEYNVLRRQKVTKPVPGTPDCLLLPSLSCSWPLGPCFLPVVQYPGVQPLPRN